MKDVKIGNVRISVNNLEEQKVGAFYIKLNKSGELKIRTENSPTIHVLRCRGEGKGMRISLAKDEGFFEPVNGGWGPGFNILPAKLKN